MLLISDLGVRQDSGGVVICASRKVLLREVAGHFDGYAWTFAKTEATPHESVQEAAIRAVREKTGYEASIMLAIPGLFRGSSTVTRYFLMDASHPPTKHNWQTSSLRWATFEEARRLIDQSDNIMGRERDAEVLLAAEMVAAFKEADVSPRVQPEDWPHLLPMSEYRTVTPRDLAFRPTEMTRIRRGFFSMSMDDHWFIYFSGSRLRLYRSWTGVLALDVGFAEKADSNSCVTDILVNTATGVLEKADDEKVQQQVESVIRYCLLK